MTGKSLARRGRLIILASAAALTLLAAVWTISDGWTANHISGNTAAGVKMTVKGVERHPQEPKQARIRTSSGADDESDSLTSPGQDREGRLWGDSVTAAKLSLEGVPPAHVEGPFEVSLDGYAGGGARLAFDGHRDIVVNPAAWRAVPGGWDLGQVSPQIAMGGSLAHLYQENGGPIAGAEIMIPPLSSGALAGLQSAKTANTLSAYKSIAVTGADGAFTYPLARRTPPLVRWNGEIYIPEFFGPDDEGALKIVLGECNVPASFEAPDEWNISCGLSTWVGALPLKVAFNAGRGGERIQLPVGEYTFYSNDPYSPFAGAAGERVMRRSVQTGDCGTAIALALNRGARVDFLGDFFSEGAAWELSYYCWLRSEEIPLGRETYIAENGSLGVPVANVIDIAIGITDAAVLATYGARLTQAGSSVSLELDCLLLGQMKRQEGGAYPLEGPSSGKALNGRRFSVVWSDGWPLVGTASFTGSDHPISCPAGPRARLPTGFPATGQVTFSGSDTALGYHVESVGTFDRVWLDAEAPEIEVHWDSAMVQYQPTYGLYAHSEKRTLAPSSSTTLIDRYRGLSPGRYSFGPERLVRMLGSTSFSKSSSSLGEVVEVDVGDQVALHVDLNDAYTPRLVQVRGDADRLVVGVAVGFPRGFYAEYMTWVADLSPARPVEEMPRWLPLSLNTLVFSRADGEVYGPVASFSSGRSLDVSQGDYSVLASLEWERLLLSGPGGVQAKLPAKLRGLSLALPSGEFVMEYLRNGEVVESERVIIP